MAWRCRQIGHDPDWHTIDTVLVCQCTRCPTVLAVVTQSPPHRLSASALDALQNTDGRQADDWPMGFLD